VLHFSVQVDHVHVIVEGDSTRALVRGIQGLSGRCAKAINNATGHAGPVWEHRYHAHELASPSEVRKTIAYVLLNFRKHLRASAGIDPRSSGPWFEGWAKRIPLPATPSPVATPRTWLAATGWRRAGGPIHLHEAPAARPRRS
jgi:hypothetical protein